MKLKAFLTETIEKFKRNKQFKKKKKKSQSIGTNKVSIYEEKFYVLKKIYLILIALNVMWLWHNNLDPQNRARKRWKMKGKEKEMKCLESNKWGNERISLQEYSILDHFDYLPNTQFPHQNIHKF